MASEALEVEAVTKRFGGLTAVDSASLTLRPNGIHGLIGPNGAGKSTMIGLISGFLAPDAGRISFAGRDLVGLAPAAIAQCGIARTFQQATPFAGLTTVENVMVGMHVHYGAGIGGILARTGTMRREERRNEAEARGVLDRFGLADVADVDAADLPFGKLRFLEIARSMAARPRMLLLDEPAAGLNGAETVALGALIRDLSAQGIGVLLVDHDVPFVFGLCDRITVMNFGSVIASGPPEDVHSSEAVREAYLGTGAEMEDA